MTWNDGYVTEVEYTHGYYRELSPVHLDFALLLKGLARPKSRPLRYLELGFGHGLSLNIHAATCSGSFWGTDFLPQQAHNAMARAEQSGADLRILNDSFAELEARTDLPEFDVIGLHGIWSWISPEARENIAGIIRRRLAVGGLVYISYNAQPGWSPAMPMRHLMALHAQSRKSETIQNRIASAIQLFEKLSHAKGVYLAAVPSVLDRLNKMKNLDPRYVAHEYFNENWHCSNFSEIASTMAACRLDFAGSAHILDHVNGIQFTAEGQQLLAAETDVVMRETLRDYLVNQQFRRDIYVKGARRLQVNEQLQALAATPLALIAVPEDIKYQVIGSRGQVQLKKEIYEPFIELLAATRQDLYTIGEVCRHFSATYTLEVVMEAIQVLVGSGMLCAAQDATEAEANRSKVKALNSALIEAALHTDDAQFLASPEVGGGIPVPRISRLLIKARNEGAQTDEDLLHATLPRVRQSNPLSATASPPIFGQDVYQSLNNDIGKFRERESLYKRLGLF